ncbi:hypothetical protein PQI07_03290 [Methylobacterium sp. 092160098-2]|uniref:Protein of unassigned function n=1 Tax=Methylobacterium oryzae CBMB20 TaxID=693986 RepID=A0A089NN61_9HYPH|nr:MULTISPECIES: hypothetical protein [Methylobacterium]AIQ87945.1 protein of unassigned function [Methylobacterium oryzae CBMB20]MDE4909723.1 hypothetical protein [Methylobacterium sp. 092160098-2]WFS07957.1 hypothetical protein P9K36_01250 [Methylobacterium sp. 391_Methyba4]
MNNRDTHHSFLVGTPDAGPINTVLPPPPVTASKGALERVMETSALKKGSPPRQQLEIGPVQMCNTECKLNFYELVTLIIGILCTVSAWLRSMHWQRKPVAACAAEILRGAGYEAIGVG